MQAEHELQAWREWAQRTYSDTEEVRWDDMTLRECVERRYASERRKAILKTGAAMWAALDVVKEHLGGFDAWPQALKEAFSEAIIDTAPLSQADIRRTHELAKQYGWS